MPLERTQSPPQLVIHDNGTVWTAEPNGQILNHEKKGLFFRDTRLISGWTVTANGEPWDLLNAGAIAHFATQIFLTNRQITTRDGIIARRTLGLMLGRHIGGGIHEDLELTNHNQVEVRFNLEIMIRSDFADVFEVKDAATLSRGRIETIWSREHQHLKMTYDNQDFHRAVGVTARGDSPVVYANGHLSFDVTIPPAATWRTCLLYDLEDGDTFIPAPTDCIHGIDRAPSARRLSEWLNRTLTLKTNNEDFHRTYAQAVEDMASLRLSIEDRHGNPHVVPAAGLPWFMVLFGRDSIIASLQTGVLGSEFAEGTLALLGESQARGRDDYHDAEPGKIMHEIRRGELAHFKLIPHTPYYGTADATALYLMLLHAVWRWTGDKDLIRRHLETAERCLTWIDDSGDRDGDGYQEYQTRSPVGYENMGWKDADDAVLHADGSRAQGPKALCELQAYVYAAWQGMAELYDALGNPEAAIRLRQKAQTLYDNFNEDFWDEDLGFYVFGLDGSKQKIRSITSNVGHCLWTGIIRPDRARQVADRLMAKDMFADWGVRTLSATHPGFNPISYHNGSIWPHDNGIVAQGLKRYGFHAEAAQIAKGITTAAAYFGTHQIPELFAGINQKAARFPVPYLGTNVPQAWAAGATFAFLQAMLGIEPDAPNNRLLINPTLPDWLPDLTLHRLRLGQHTLDIRFWRDGEATRHEVLSGDPTIVITKPL